MTSNDWLKANLPIIPTPYGDSIDWGNGMSTTIVNFVTMIDSVIQSALTANTNVRQAIRDNDNGRGFANLI